MVYNLKGVNYFTNTKIDENNFTTYIEDQPVFDIKLEDLNNIYSKENELTLELKNDIDDNIECSEIRFFCPPIIKEKVVKKTKNEENENEEDNNENKEENNNENKEDNDNKEDEEEEEIIEEKIIYSKELENQIKLKSNLDFENSQFICHLQNLQFTVPRGKYSCYFYEKQIKFHGQTFNFFVYYKNIFKIFLLPHEDNNMIFVICLEQPLRIGKSSYYFLLLQFKSNKEEEVNINIYDEKIKKLNLNLEKNYSGFYYEIFGKLLKNILGINIIIPGQFKSCDGEPCFRANNKYNQGDLFFLDDSILFIKKPIIYIKLKDITKIEYLRTKGKAIKTNFDFNIVISNGTSYSFNNIKRDNFEIIMDYFNENKITQKEVEEEEFDQLSDGYESDEDDINNEKGLEEEEEDDDDEENNKFIEKQNDSESEDEDYNPEK